MGIHLFHTRDVDEKLTELTNLLHILETTVIGLEAMCALDKSSSGGLLSIITMTKDKAALLEKSRDTISRNWQADKTMILIGE